MAPIGSWLRGAALAAVLLVVAPAAAGAQNVSPRIVGGTQTTNPGWIAYMDIAFPDGNTLCGGALIAKRWILTAAHCVTPEGSTTAVSPSAVTVWVGLDTLSQSFTDPGSTVQQVVVDPDYDPVSLQGDVALVHLSTSSAEEPVALGGPDDPVVGSVPTVLGWGVTDSLTEQISDTLLKAAAPVLDPSRCDAVFSGFDAASKICAGGKPGEDSCQGDSGGPLALSPMTPLAVLVGIVDYGSLPCGDGTPAVYQRITRGPVAAFLASNAPTAHIRTTAAAVMGKTTTATATSRLPGASYAWDLDADGQYDDSTGASVPLAFGTVPRSVGVRATGSDGEAAAQRMTITPKPGSVAVSAPADVREGDTIKLSFARSGLGSGSLLAALSAPGVAPIERIVPVEGSGTLEFPLPNDSTWQPPRSMTIAVMSRILSLTTRPTLWVRISDDDRPSLSLGRIRRWGTRTLAVSVRAPGSGKVTLTAKRGTRVLVRKTVKMMGIQRRVVALRFSRADQRRLRGSRPLLKGVWRSTDAPGTTASRNVRGLALRAPRS
jgi:hypothetical protein